LHARTSLFGDIITDDGRLGREAGKHCLKRRTHHVNILSEAGQHSATDGAFVQIFAIREKNELVLPVVLRKKCAQMVHLCLCFFHFGGV